MKNMMLFVALTVLTAPGFADRTTGQAMVIKVAPGELVIEHPTLINLGFEWVIQVDRGVVLANVTDGFAGRAPDLGALEYGQAPPHYGPRQ